MPIRAAARAAACALLLFVPLAWAQPQVQGLTLAQVLAAARGNADVLLATRAAAAAQADIAAANHAPAPVLSAKAASIDLQNGIGPGNVLRDKRIDKSIGADWTWERGNKRELRTQAAQWAAQAAQADLREARTQQQLAAANAFYDLLAAQERARQMDALAAGAAQLADTSTRRQRAGDTSQQEVARTEIEARRAAADHRSAQADAARAALALAQLTRLPMPVAAQEAWPTLEAAPAQGSATATRADVQAAQHRVEAARAALALAQALRRNDVTVGGSVDHFPGTSNRQLELRVSLPLAGVLGGYDYQGEIGRAQAQLAAAQDQLDKVSAAAAADSQRLLADLDASAQRAGTYHEAIVPRARQVAQMAELAHARGAMPLAELIDARRTLRGVLLEEIAARADHAKALAAWRLRSTRDED
ncbi:TolC family protein [Ramlibacter albus]|uniref:TolC family protein n=1 Tax=Ramlibacter albus TaxID=2079448 RepID=A0A923M6Z4_9BURK|nr:TolC family protein [Ramlibacter albus]MBC5764053.1 TolC family protein [Ramlibacter albus]